MIKVQIIESEKLEKYADFENCEVWLLNRETGKSLDSRLINISELTESALPSTHKFPQLMTEIFARHPNEDIYEDVEVLDVNEDGSPKLDENGQRIKHIENMLVGSAMTFTYEVLTDKKQNFQINAYICDEDYIKEVK